MRLLVYSQGVCINWHLILLCIRAECHVARCETVRVLDAPYLCMARLCVKICLACSADHSVVQIDRDSHAK